MQFVAGRLVAVIVIALSAVAARAEEKRVSPENTSANERKASSDGKTSKSTASSTNAAGDEDIKPESLPKPIKNAIRKRFPRSKIVSAEKGTEYGKPIYEASIESEKHKIDVTLDPDGKILSFEKALLASERPKLMMQSLNAKYPHATIKLVEEVWENDKFTGYEVTVVDANKKSLDVSFDKKGKLVEDEKK